MPTVRDAYEGVTDLVDEIRAALRAAADATRAPQMQAYMKSSMPYLGVRVPDVRAIVRARLTAAPLRSAHDVPAVVGMLWDDARHREERYAASAVLGAPGTVRLGGPSLIELVERLIVSGAWWDHVDELSHRVGELLLLFPDDARPIVVGWQRSADMWLRRSSIICQLGAKARTDLQLLTDAIAANAADGEFFVRKAIGWALRDYARTDADWVRNFVAGRELSPLSRREALKHL